MGIYILKLPYDGCGSERVKIGTQQILVRNAHVIALALYYKILYGLYNSVKLIFEMSLG